jgi:hypothetical protein
MPTASGNRYEQRDGSSTADTGSFASISRESPEVVRQAGPMDTLDRLEVLSFADASRWESWLADHHDDRDGVWLRIAKKGSAARSVSVGEALEVALCFGWIDSHRKSLDASHFIRKYTPRRPRSSRSKVNTDRVKALIGAGRMRGPGLAQVAAATAGGTRRTPPSAPPRCRLTSRPPWRKATRPHEPSARSASQIGTP